jgi:DNA-binding transcriptional regulator GbsR (MarR family)
MAIDKFEGSMSKEESGCTIVINQTMQSISDPYVLAIYAYLITKPSNWRINITEIRNHFGFCKDKTYSVINKLIDIGLLENEKTRENGKFSRTNYKLLLKPLASTELPPCPVLRDTVLRDTVKQDAYKTKKDLIQNKDNNNISDNPSFVKTEEVVNAYHETLPESPKIRVIGNQISNQIKRMQQDWPKYANGKQFTLESFIKFLTIILTRYPWFLNKYTTDGGNIRQNNLTNITREQNIVKIINGEFSQNE